MLFTCGLSKFRHTHNIEHYCLSTETVVMQKHLSVMLYVHCLSCLLTTACHRDVAARFEL